MKTTVEKITFDKNAMNVIGYSSLLRFFEMTTEIDILAQEATALGILVITNSINVTSKIEFFLK